MGIHRLHPEGDPATGFVKGDEVQPSEFTTSDHTELIHFAHLNEKTGVSSGTWKCAPYKAHFESYPCDEMMVVLDGVLKLTDSNGTIETFTKGDTLFISKGTSLTWEITETMHKYFMISE